MPEIHNKLVSRIEELEKNKEQVKEHIKDCLDCDNSKANRYDACRFHFAIIIQIEAELKILNEWLKREEEILEKIENITTFNPSFNARGMMEINKQGEYINKQDLKKELKKMANISTQIEYKTINGIRYKILYTPFGKKYFKELKK